MSIRGYAPKDEKEFGEKGIQMLRKSAEDLVYLVNRGYPMRKLV